MGYLRFSAAFAVAIHHLWGVEGNATVFCFYLLTGFIVAFLSSEVYTGRNGALRLIASQAMRIYPAYWACALVSALLIILLGEAMRDIHTSLRFPRDIDGWQRQVSTFGLLLWPYHTYYIRLLPSAWSLNIILVYYVLIAFLIGGSLRRSIVFLALSVLVTAGCLASGLTFKHLYYSFYGPAVAFATGTVLYHAGRRLPEDFMLSKAGVTGILLGVNLLFYFPGMAGFKVEDYPLYRYAVFVLVGVMMMMLFRTDGKRRPSGLNTLAGELSYPIFLLHWPVGGLVLNMLGLPRGAQDGTLFVVTLAISIIIGLGIIYWVERPLKRFRSALRRAS
jgi:peptidoglycan/LPS O-acetylase OafA/YrhL